MGSQIVAMAKAVAIQLGVAWDPDFRIKMQSANGQVELSKGLARNISFQLGEVTVYLQVHVINNPAYEVLLGRPFDVLTKTISETLPDGGMLQILIQEKDLPFQHLKEAKDQLLKVLLLRVFADQWVDNRSRRVSVNS